MLTWTESKTGGMNMVERQTGGVCVTETEYSGCVEKVLTYASLYTVLCKSLFCLKYIKKIV